MSLEYLTKYHITQLIAETLDIKYEDIESIEKASKGALALILSRLSDLTDAARSD